LSRTRFAAFTHAIGAADDPRAIRRQARHDGYLFCPGLAAPRTISALRGLVVDVASDLGWLDRRTRRERGISVSGVRLGAYDDPRWIEFLRIVLRHPLFAALRAEPNIIGVVEAIVGGRCEPETGDLCRVVSGDDPLHTTVAHQDHFYLPGESSRWSAWVPLGDCPVSLGPLAILPGSHRRGLLAHRGDSVSRQAVRVRTGRWAAQDLKAGDVLIFNWLTVHRALPNQRGRELRISATCRYRRSKTD
jgi:ectoine hydroxylase-related dioxygenase (phytanoyl-CoA dioxygenase family)